MKKVFVAMVEVPIWPCNSHQAANYKSCQVRGSSGSAGPHNKAK